MSRGWCRVSDAGVIESRDSVSIFEARKRPDFRRILAHLEGNDAFHERNVAFVQGNDAFHERTFALPRR